MRQIIHHHKEFWSQKPNIISTIFGVLLLVLSLLVNYFANIYTSLRASNYVSDLILDNLPVLNVDYIFIEGFILFWIFVVLILAKEPRKTPFVLKSIALFVIIRSIFISLTHIAEPPNLSTIDPNSIFFTLTSGNDLFFSSHTGLPFLMALIFWRYKKLRLAFLTAALIFAFSVLLGHLHYSIDVFAAFFISYGIFHIARKLFSQDYEAHFLDNDRI